jgi:hypothetical protein
MVASKERNWVAQLEVKKVDKLVVETAA